MGWIFAIILFVVGSIRGDAGTLIAAGAFAIAGAVGSVAMALDERKRGAGGNGSGDGNWIAK